MAKRNVIKNRRKRNMEKGISEGNSKYARKKALQRKGVFSLKSPLNPSVIKSKLDWYSHTDES